MQRASIGRHLAIVAMTLLSVFACSTAGAAPPKRWTIIDLGTLGGPSIAQAVNNRGDVAGQSDVAGFQVHPFLWSNGLMTDLGAPPVGSFGFVQGMNDRGTILVNNGISRSYLWNDGGWTELPVGGATDVNKFDAVVGSYSPVPGPSHAYLFDNGVLRDLGTLGGPGSRAQAVNDHGVVVGASQPAGTFDEHAFIYDGGTMRDLGTLGGRSSVANDVNNHGVVVGSSTLANGATVPFIHDGTAMRQLVSLPEQAVPFAINDHGAVVGWTFSGNGWLFEDGVLTRLDQIPEVRAAGWVKLSPVAINNHGWIAGQGLNASGAHAFLLIPR